MFSHCLNFRQYEVVKSLHSSNIVVQMHCRCSLAVGITRVAEPQKWNERWYILHYLPSQIWTSHYIESAGYSEKSTTLFCHSMLLKQYLHVMHTKLPFKTHPWRQIWCSGAISSSVFRLTTLSILDVMCCRQWLLAKSTFSRLVSWPACCPFCCPAVWTSVRLISNDLNAVIWPRLSTSHIDSCRATKSLECDF